MARYFLREIGPTWVVGVTILLLTSVAPSHALAEETPATVLLARLNPDVTFHRPPKPLSKEAVSEDWPCFLGIRHDAVSNETHLLKSWPKVGLTGVWEMQVGQGYASPAISGRKLVYFHRTGDSENVECLEAESGKRYWKFSYPTIYEDRYGFNGGPRASPVIDGHRVYTLGVAGLLHCLDLESGNVLFRIDTTAQFNVPQNYFGIGSTPLVEGELLFVQVGAPRGPSVVAFDKNSGELVFQTPDDDWTAGYASPVAADIHGKRRVYIFAGGDSRPTIGGLMGIDPTTGKIDFRFPWRSRKYESTNAATPLVIDNRIFITESYGLGGALLEIQPDFSQKLLWKSDKLRCHWNTPIHRGGFLYGFDGMGSKDAALVCIRLSDGSRMWREEIEWNEEIDRNGSTEAMKFTPMRGSLLWADGAFYCMGEMGHLLALDLSPQGCKVLARSWLFAARESFVLPVISRGLLYVNQTRRSFINRTPARLICYDLRADK